MTDQRSCPYIGVHLWFRQPLSLILICRKQTTTRTGGCRIIMRPAGLAMANEQRPLRWRLICENGGWLWSAFGCGWTGVSRRTTSFQSRLSSIPPNDAIPSRPLMLTPQYLRWPVRVAGCRRPRCASCDPSPKASVDRRWEHKSALIMIMVCWLLVVLQLRYRKWPLG